MPGVRSTKRLWIRLTSDERADLDQVAAENHLNVTDVLRLAVNTFVQDYREGDRDVFRQWRKRRSDDAAA